MNHRLLRIAFALMTVTLLIGAWPWATMAAPSSYAPDRMLEGTRALPTFTNVSDSVGLAGVGGTFFDWVDYNNDGFLDFIIDGHRLYQNSGPPGFTFTEVTAAKGLNNAWGRAVFGDYDNDGYVDLYDADWTDKLLHNNGPPNYDYTEVTVAAGNVMDTFPGTAASWGDFNNDGFLDLYVANGEVWHPDNTATWYPDTMWKNDGDGTFTNVTTSANVSEAKRPFYSRGATWADYNHDGYQDIFISNYRLTPNYLYRNNWNGTFTDVGKMTHAAGNGRNGQGQPGDVYYGHTIGSSWGDLNNDGLLDLLVANLAHKDPDRGRYCDDSNILINNGFPYWNFTDIRNKSGIPIKKLGGVINSYYDDENWANAAIADFDNDGYLDFYVPQVYNFSWMYSYLYQNQGNLTFKNVSHQLGLDNVVDTYAGAWGDYNNDGNMDLLTAGRQNQWSQVEVKTPARVRLYKNSGIGNHYLKVGLIGTVSNKQGVGAQVTAFVGSTKLMRQVETGMGSHGQQNDIRLNFGLGSATVIDTLEVQWPSGIVQRLKNVAVDRWINITEDSSGPRITSLTATPSTGVPDTEITLQAQFTGNPTQFSWDFEGDLIADVGTNSPAPAKFIVRAPLEYHPTLRAYNSDGSLSFVKTVIVKIHNQAPVANIGAETDADEDQNITFDASGSLDTTWDLANLTYEFDFGDGAQTGPNTSKVVFHNYSEMGNYTVKLTVTDPYSAINTSSLKIRVNNVGPTVSIIGNNSVAEDSALFLDAVGKDTPSDLAKGLKYKWDFGDGSKTGWLSKAATSHVYSEFGQFNISVQVSDHNNAKGSDIMTALVTNLAPTAQVSFKTISAKEDEQVIFEGIGTDTASDVNEGLQYKWDFGDKNSTEWAASVGASHAYIANGTYIAKFFVRDHEGRETNDTETVLISNMPPTAELLDVPTDFMEDQEVTFVGKGTDTPTDMSSLSYRWEFGDGMVSGWSQTPEAKHTYNKSGEKTIIFHVKDDDDIVVSIDAAIKVVNPAPKASITGPTKTSFEEDMAVTFLGNATDNPSDMGSLNFTWTIEGKDHYGTSVDHTFTKQGSYEIVLTVLDDDKAQDKAAITVKISNVQPKLTLAASGVSVEKGKSLSFTAKASDSASDNATLKYKWDCGAGNTLQGAGTPNAVCTFNSAGLKTVTLTVTDDDGATASAHVDITVTTKPTGGKGGISMGVVAAIAAVLVIVVVLVLFLLMRSKGIGSKAPELKDKDTAPRPKKAKVKNTEEKKKDDKKEENKK